VNVRGNGGAVNSVFLVQLRKMLATDFHGLARIVNFVEGVAVSRCGGLGSDFENASGEVFARSSERIVHTACTGNAERQWAVTSGQWSVELPARFACGTAEAAVATLVWHVGWREPCLQALVEFFWGCAYGLAVIGVGDLPENCSGIASLDSE
jgi:hypothetical protein